MRPAPSETETLRLRLRRPVLADIPDLFAFLSDAEAMRHTHRDPSLRACRRRVLVHEWRRRIDGHSPWVVLTKQDGRIVGWGGLYDDPFEPGWGVEIGYHFHPRAWGQGYATELVATCLSIADTELRLPRLRAFGIAGLVNLFGIESPGLTASLAIADHVRDLVGGVANRLAA